MAEVTLDFNKSVNQLRVLDTFHDFCTKERKKISSKKKLDDVEEEVPQSKLNGVRDYIVKLLANKYSNFAAQKESTDTKKALDQIINTITTSKLTNLSDLENKTIRYFETDTQRSTEIHADKGTRQSITFEDIVEGYKGVNEEKGEQSPLWRDYRRNRNEVSILEINKGKKSIDKYDKDQKKYIASFILNFFFSTTQGDMRCTFDAKSGVVSKIFENIEQIRNVIFPQTIADSATTTFGTMLGRNEFIFPGIKSFDMTSTIYSKGIYKLSFVNTNFDSRNPYGFSMNIAEETGAKKSSISLPFSDHQTEGPSVNYLIDILDTAKGSGNFSQIEKKKQILSLGKYIDSNAEFKKNFIDGIKRNDNGLLLDIKRGGDHEAVAATKSISSTRYPYFIFVTIDLLCALESRRQGLPTIWHFGERMILYRFPIVYSEALAAEQKLKDTQDRIKDALSSITIIETIRTTVRTQLQRQLVDVTNGKTALVDVYKPSAVEPAYQQPCEKILIYLLQQRMAQFERQITGANSAVPAIPAEIAGYKDMLDKAQKITKISEWTFGSDQNYSISVKMNGVDQDIKDIIKKVSDTFESFITQVNSALKINAPIAITTSNKVLTKTYQIYKKYLVPCLDKRTGATCAENLDAANKVYVIDEVDNSAFEYDAMPFYSLYNSLILLSEATGKATVENKLASRTYENFMRAELKNLQKSAQSVLSQFDDTAKATIKDSKLFTVPMNDFAGVIESIDTSSVPAVFRKTAGGSYQVGGDAQQYYDLADTLLMISTIAAAFIESCYSKFYPGQAFLTSIKEVTKYKPGLAENKEGKNKLMLSYLQTTLVKGYYYARKVANAELKTELAAIDQDVKEAKPLNKDTLLAAVGKFEAIQATYLSALTSPSIEEFYDKIMGDNDSLVAARENVETMQYIWETALYFIQTTKDYSYLADKAERSLSTEELITYILSLSVPPGKEHDPNSIQSQSVISENIETELATNPKRKVEMTAIKDKAMLYRQEKAGNIRYNVSIPILMIFTILENIQNPTKYSFFLKEGHKNLYYVSQADWNTQLWTDIKGIINNIKTNLKQKNQLTLAGGKRISKYAKKTRKNKAKRTKRMTKRRKH